MKKAKWIIVLIVAVVGAYFIYIEKFAGVQDSDQTEKVNKSGVQVKTRYDDKGNIKSDAEFVNGVRHGVAHNYYADGSVHSEIHYKNNFKEGNSTWFYEDGTPYRITPFIKGKKQGIQKKFYKSGKLMAEIPYERGKLIPGTKEYSEDGKLVKYPEILIKERDFTLTENVFYLDISLSEKVNKPTLKIEDQNGNKTIPVKKTDNKTFRFNFLSLPNNVEFKEVTIFIEFKSELNNPVIITKKHRVVLGG